MNTLAIGTKWHLPRQWRLPLATVVALILVMLVTYLGTFSAMVAIWARSDTFAHAYLVPPIVLWLIWRQRGRVLALTPQAQPLALLPMGLCGMAWLLGDLAGVNALTQLAGTGLLVCTVPALLGWPVARALAFPLGFLFFMVPIGEFVMPAMMDWTADVTVMVVRLIGIPVYREGLQFVIPSGSWSVVEACSGVRYLIASFMVGTLFAYLNYTSTKRRLLFVLVSLAVPILANWARAVMIVLLGHYSGNRLAVGVDHLVYGWVFFGIVIGIMFFVGSRWAEVPAVADETPAASPGSRVAAVPQWSMAGLALLVLAAPALLSGHVQGAQAKTAALHLPSIPAGAVDGDAAPLHSPVFVGARAEAVGVYGRGDQAITLHVAYYRQQTYGRKLVNSQNMLVASNDKAWRQTHAGFVSVQVDGQPVALRTAELRRGNVGATGAAYPLQVRQIFWVNGHWTTSDHLAALLGVMGQLTDQGDDAAALTFYMAQRPDSGDGSALDSFVAANLSALGNWLQGVRTDR